MADTKKPDDKDQDDPKDLRAKLEEVIATNKQLTDRVNGYEQREKLTEAGFGHLNARQQKSLLREMADDGVTEFTPEALEPIVKDLGYPLKAETSTTTTTTTQDAGSNGEQGQQGQGQGNSDDGADTGFDPVAASMRGFDLMQTAQQAAVNGRVSPDLETQMREAKSPDELRAVIRSKGAQSGIVHSFDVE